MNTNNTPTKIYNTQQRNILLTTARKSIQSGLNAQQQMQGATQSAMHSVQNTDHSLQSNTHPLQVNVAEYEPLLQQQRACFVTLQIHGNLRGCIGSLVAHRPLIADVAHNAYAAAFTDHRFKPLTPAEFPQIELHISVLSPTEKIYFHSEADLLSKIRPNIDGLILSYGSHRGTFLPSVWEQLPDPKEFLQHLKNKAGLPTTFWDDGIQIERYTTEMFD